MDLIRVFFPRIPKRNLTVLKENRQVDSFFTSSSSLSSVPPATEQKARRDFSKLVLWKPHRKSSSLTPLLWFPSPRLWILKALFFSCVFVLQFSFFHCLPLLSRFHLYSGVFLDSSAGACLLWMICLGFFLSFLLDELFFYLLYCSKKRFCTL